MSNFRASQQSIFLFPSPPLSGRSGGAFPFGGGWEGLLCIKEALLYFSFLIRINKHQTAMSKLLF